MRPHPGRMVSSVEASAASAGDIVSARHAGYAGASPSAPLRLLAWLGSDRLLALVVFLLALALNLYQLTDRSVAFDEAFSIDLASQRVDVILAAGWGNEAHMTLYYLLLHDWMALTSSLGFASTETMVRLISVISSAMGAATLFLLAWRFMGRWVAVVATALYLCNFEQLLFAQFTRSYALQLLLGCLSWYALVYALVSATRHTGNTSLRRRALWWALYVTITTIFIYAQIFSVLVVAGQVVAFALIYFVPNGWQTLARRQSRAFAASIAIIGLLSGLILVDGLLHGGNNGWVPDATLASVFPTLGALLYAPQGNIGSVFGGLFVALVGVLCLIAILAPWLGGYIAELSRIADDVRLPGEALGPADAASPASPDPAAMPREAAVIIAASWFLVPFALAFVGTTSIHNFHLFYTRYLIVLLPGLFLLVGLGVQALPRPSLRLAPALLLVTIAAASLPAYYESYQSAGSWDVRGAVQWMEQRHQSGDGIVCLPGYVCSVPVQYYLNLSRQRGQGQARFDNSPGQFHFDPPWLGRSDTTAIAAYAKAHPRIFVITITYGASDKSAWLSQHYHLQATYKTDMVTVRLYETQSAGSLAGP